MLKPAQRRLLSAWLPVIIWMGVIFVASTDLGASKNTSQVIEPLVHWVKPDATEEQVNLVHFLVRKAAHLTEYALLGILVLRALKLSSERLNKNLLAAAAGALALCALYASSDEFHQSFVGDRTPCVQDVLIDSSGALLAIAGATAVRMALGKRACQRPAGEKPNASAAFEPSQR